MWHEVTDSFRREFIAHKLPGIEYVWRDYFGCWSTQESFDSYGPFEPLEIAAELDNPRAKELLAQVAEFSISDDLIDTRRDFSLLQDVFVDWIVDYIPIVPSGLDMWFGFQIDNTEENRAKLREMDPYHIWTVVWGNVVYLVEDFWDLEDAQGYFMTQVPHEANGSSVCDLCQEITCLLCSGEAESDQGTECPACENVGQITVDATISSMLIARKEIPPSIRPNTGWCG